MNLNQSNQNTQTAVNRFQNSLNKLQTTINNKTTNMAHRPKILIYAKKFWTPEMILIKRMMIC